MKLSKRFLLALSTGYILYFYSERIFWSFPRPVRWRSLLLLFIMPITAALIYNAMNSAGLIWGTNLFIMIISTAIGFILFIASAIKILRPKNALNN